MYNKRNYIRGGYHLIRIDENTLSSRKNLKIDSDCVSCTLLSLGFPREVIDSVLETRHELKDDEGNVLKKGIKINKLVNILNKYLAPISTMIKKQDHLITNNENLTNVLNFIYESVLEPATITFISYNYKRPDGRLGGHMMLVAKTITPTYYLIDARAPRDQNPNSIYSQDTLDFSEGSPIFNFFKFKGGVLSSKGTVIDRITTYQSYCMYSKKLVKIIHEHPEIDYGDLEYDKKNLTLTKTFTPGPPIKSYFIWHGNRRIVLPMISPPLSIVSAIIYAAQNNPM